ncbi:DUF6216 family protein [Pseudomonas putida]|uniref:DUF6216 family protein n=1 Tax=Pseudomonas putida TaxID=303 RepID=UPI0012AC91E4|nr:DUF6216 family protein [Pseudomonas putida]
MNIVDFIFKVWPLVATVFVVAVVLKRTNSFFFFYHRAFQLLGAEKKFSNHSDQKAWDEYLSLMSFNLQLGFGLESLKNKQAFHKWRSEHGLEIVELRMAGPYFHANKLEFKVVKIWWQVLRTMIIVPMIFILFYWGSIFSSAESALWQAKGTEPWFWATESSARDFYYDVPLDFDWLKSRRWKLESADCRYDVEPPEYIGAWIKGVACLSIVGLYPGEVEKTVASQKRFGFFLLSLTIVLSAWLIALETWTAQAKRLQIRLAQQGGVEPLASISEPDSSTCAG